MINFLIFSPIFLYFFCLSKDFFLYCLDKLGRKRVILDRESNEPYLERYYLFLKDRGSFPFNIFLHKFLKSDPDDLHDHPWGYTTIILSGGYWEYTKQGKFWRKPFFYQTVPATHCHRIEIEYNTSATWTLFIPHKKEREWGFYKSCTRFDCIVQW